MKFAQNSNAYSYKYSVEFVCENAGLDENLNNNFTIFPNPASNQININCENINEVLIYNALGQLVYEKAGECDMLTIDATAFEEGLYVVNVKKINGEAVSQRIVIKK